MAVLFLALLRNAELVLLLLLHLHEAPNNRWKKISNFTIKARRAQASRTLWVKVGDFACAQLAVTTKFSSTDKRQVDDLQLGQAISTDKRQVDVDHEVNPGDNGRAEDRVGF